MNRYRSAVQVLAPCAIGLALAACSAGITTASSAASSHPASSPAASRSAAVSSAQASTVTVGGSIGRFPIPPGASVVENAAEGKQIVVIIGSVSPQKASTFYTSALPQSGYKITMNELCTNGNQGSALGIEFTGHGYKGVITAASDVTGISLGPSGSKDVLAITFTKQ